MSDIFEEVDEALAQDKSLQIWRVVRPFVYGGVAVLVIGVGAWEFMKWQGDQSQNNEATAFYAAQTALEANDYVAAEALFSEIANSNSAYATLAGHYLAQVELSGLGDRAAAIEALDTAAGQDGPMADIALMKSAYLQANTLSVEELETMLTPILDSDGMTLVYLAEELIASRAYQLGDLAEARRRFEMISFSLDASDGVKQRAQQALAALDTLAQLDGTNQTNGVTQ